MNPGRSTTLVIPCYNEAARLDRDAFLGFVENHPDVDLLFVNDGSTDGTAGAIESLAGSSDRIRTRHLDVNSGKAEAVRLGMLESFPRTDYAGYWDADLSTPLSESDALRDVLDSRPEIDIVTGARVKMVGRCIERNPFRHYTGRAFATAVSALFGIEMYDTQCGAKLFRCGPETRGIFSEPYHTRWIFDVELLVRFGNCEGKSIEGNLVEVPLQAWREVPGTRMRPTDFLRAPLELLRIHYAYFGPS